MNKKRFEKIIWELQKENSEIKISKEQIESSFEGFSVLSESMKPTDNYKNSLKSRISAISQYSAREKLEKKNYFKFFIPVFSFWFAIFGVFFFVNDFSAPTQNESEFTPYSMVTESEDQISDDMAMWALMHIDDASEVEDTDVHPEMMLDSNVPQLKTWLRTTIAPKVLVDDSQVEESRKSDTAITNKRDEKIADTVTPAAVMSLPPRISEDNNNDTEHSEPEMTGFAMGNAGTQSVEENTGDAITNNQREKSEMIDESFSIDSMIDEVFNDLDTEELELTFEEECKSLSWAVYSTGSKNNSCTLNSIICSENQFDNNQCDLFDKK